MDQQNLNWKLRRVAAGLRQSDVGPKAGISTSRYSAIERGDARPTPQDREHIEGVLPQLPKDAVASTVTPISPELDENRPGEWVTRSSDGFTSKQLQH